MAFSSKHPEFEFYFPHQYSIVPNDSRETLRASDYLLCEITKPSTGQGIEMGFAASFNIPIIAICEENRTYSTSISLLTKSISYYKPPLDEDFLSGLFQILGI